MTRGIYTVQLWTPAFGKRSKQVSHTYTVLAESEEEALGRAHAFLNERMGEQYPPPERILSFIPCNVSRTQLALLSTEDREALRKRIFDDE